MAVDHTLEELMGQIGKYHGKYSIFLFTDFFPVHLFTCVKFVFYGAHDRVSRI